MQVTEGRIYFHGLSPYVSNICSFKTIFQQVRKKLGIFLDFLILRNGHPTLPNRSPSFETTNSNYMSTVHFTKQLKLAIALSSSTIFPSPFANCCFFPLSGLFYFFKSKYFQKQIDHPFVSEVLGVLRKWNITLTKAYLNVMANNING